MLWATVASQSETFFMPVYKCRLESGLGLHSCVLLLREAQEISRVSKNIQSPHTSVTN